MLFSLLFAGTLLHEYKKTFQVVHDYLNSKMVCGIVTKVNNNTNMPFMTHQQLQNKGLFVVFTGVFFFFLFVCLS